MKLRLVIVFIQEHVDMLALALCGYLSYFMISIGLVLGKLD